MKKKVLAVLLTVAILSSLLVTAAGAVSVGDFTDVARDSWYYEYVDTVSAKGYMIGVSATEFAPEENMTRAMFVTVLARVAGAKVDDTAVSFSDVPANTWYTGAVAWAAKNGITNGVGDNLFAPDAYVTRQDMCTFMARFVEYYASAHGTSHKNNGKVESFPDVASVADYAVKAVDNCRAWGLIQGFEDGTFRPVDFSTRAQVATVISRLDWLVRNTTSDNPTREDHSVTVTLTLPEDSAIESRFNVGNLDLEASYTTSSAAYATIASDLIDGENETAIRSYINNALTSKFANDYSRTVPYGDYEVTVTVKDGVISATASVPMSMVITQGSDSVDATIDITTGNYENAVKLLEALNSEEGTTVTIADVDILQYIITEAAKVQDMTEGEIEDLIAEKAPESVKSAAAGLTADEIKASVGDYASDIQELQTQVIETTAEASGISVDELTALVADNKTADIADALDKAGVSVDATTVTPEVSGNITVNVDLGVYYKNALNQNDAVVDALKDWLKGLVDADITEELKTVDALVAAYKTVPVTPNVDGTLTLSKDSDDYYNYISGVVEAAAAAHDAFVGVEGFYEALVNAVNTRVGAIKGVDAELPDASLLNNTKLTFEDAKGPYAVTVTPSVAYKSIIDYILRAENAPASLVNAAKSAPEYDNLPELVRNYLVGDFTVTVTVK